MARIRRLTRRHFGRMRSAEVAASAPFRVRVGMTRWWLGLFVLLAAMLVICTIVLSLVDGSDTLGGRGGRYGGALLAFSPVVVICLIPYIAGVIAPRHLVVTEDGVSTWAWSVDWVDVQAVGFTGGLDSHAVKAVLYVDEELWKAELQRANRWDSGVPLGAGGLLSSVPGVQTQANLQPDVFELRQVFEILHRQAWQRAGHRGGFHDGRPVMPDGRRAIAPNVPAPEDASSGECRTDPPGGASEAGSTPS